MPCLTRATQVRIIEDQQAAKRREHDKQQRAKNMELMQHVKLLRSDLQQQVGACDVFKQRNFASSSFRFDPWKCSGSRSIRRSCWSASAPMPPKLPTSKPRLKVPGLKLRN